MTSEELRERDEQILWAHACGETFASIAAECELSPERVRQVYEAQRRSYIDAIDMSLRIAHAEARPVLVPLVLPDAIEDDQVHTFKFVHWVLAELLRRDRDVEVHYEPHDDGRLTFALEDVSHVRHQHESTGGKR